MLIESFIQSFFAVAVIIPIVRFGPLAFSLPRNLWPISEKLSIHATNLITPLRTDTQKTNQDNRARSAVSADGSSVSIGV